ncbi:zinc-binding dehydrogenase [Podospora didyma]|uniref:Zinc-binding dehydrogenase n=1 Tax=Podospora didyma TaxID=330526 RepID=A0AAE0K5R3_9PEZI|nr:zinc-binding dehydrogenase [Podospora didyma]
MKQRLLDPSALPTTQKAIIQDPSGHPKITHTVPLPTLGPGNLLVKVSMVALNPYDFKMGSAFPCPGAVVGNDFVGRVVEIHDPRQTSTDVRVGDVVCGLVHGSNPWDPNNGAFAEFLRVPADLVLKVPRGLEMSDAAGLGSALATACVALWGDGGLQVGFTPEAPAREGEAEPVLVYGGSTATGTMALQLLRASGVPCFATCSPRNSELVKGFGAAGVFDYAEADVAQRIRRETGGELQCALDVIADRESAACCLAAIGRVGGRLVCLEACPEEWRTRRTVEVKCPIALEVFGKEIRVLRGGERATGYERPASAETRAAAVRCFAMFQRLLDDGRLRAHPVKVLPAGFQSVVDGLMVLKSGSVSGCKLVVPLV